MQLRKMFLALGLLAMASKAFAVNKVIYGNDDRLDLYEVANSRQAELAHSTAAMIPASQLLVQDDGTIELSGAVLKERGICEDARFADQLTIASCSAFLVAPDLVVTAGHCVRSEWDCRSNKWVFGYEINRPSRGDVFSIEESDVYGCSEIVQRELSRTDSNDFALIRLDRPVLNRTPLKFRTEGTIKDHAKLFVIGHPTGLPAKVATGASVRNNSDDVFFVANLDTFGGNSGSAVFNLETGEVEGILVRGENDYVLNEEKGCHEPYRCADDECRGEDVTRITNISYLMDMVH